MKRTASKNVVWSAADYASNSKVQQLWARELIAKLKLRGNERILDVGCGDGKITAEIARAVPHGEAVGMDASPQMIEFAARKFSHPNLKFQVIDARKIKPAVFSSPSPPPKEDLSCLGSNERNPLEAEARRGLSERERASHWAGVRGRSDVQLAIAARRKSQTELSDLGKLLTDKSARQTALEATGDLHDSTVITEIGRLQIFTALLPRRIAAKEAADAKAEESLIKATNEFIQQHLGPRIRKLAAQTREQVEAELSPHFQDRAALTRAIAESQRVRSIEALAWTSTSHPARPSPIIPTRTSSGPCCSAVPSS